jgi:hypothetical protein
MATNGRLDVNTLTKVPLTAGGFGYLEKGTASGWFAARADLIQTTGIVPVIIEDGLYRDYARQVYWKTYWTRLGKPENAATPGTSNHGLALCVDINNISAYNQKTLDIVMARHGFVRDTTESWHYHHTSTNPADSGSTPIESIDMPLTDAEIDAIALKVWTYSLGNKQGGPGAVFGRAADWLTNESDAIAALSSAVTTLKSVVDSINAKVTAQGTAAPGSFSAADRAMLDDIANKAELSSALTNTVNLVNSHADANKAQIIQEIDTHSGTAGTPSAFTATITPVEN